MGRPKDQQFWDCVERIDAGLQCKFCGKVLRGNPSITRIKFHLSGVTGRGVHICEKVPDDVKAGACEAIQESTNRRQTRRSSSYTVVRLNQVEGQVEIQQMPFEHHVRDHIEAENLIENNGGEPVQRVETREEFQPNENTKRALSTTEWMDEEIQPDESSGESLVREQMGEEIQGLESNKRHKTMPSSSYLRVPTNEVDSSMGIELTPYPVQGIGHPAEIENLTGDNGGEAMQPIETKGETLLTTELVGEQFQNKLAEIWDCLMDDSVSRIGVYGMGGVGKTELAKHLNNRLLKTPNSFYHVCWVTVSQFIEPKKCICKLQNLLAKAMDLDLSRVDDEHIRAAKLWKALNKGQKSVLILDDVWDYIPLNKVGIPVSMDGCKLVLTTRSLDECRKMNCQKSIKVNCLSRDEGVHLFMKELGNGTTLPEGVEELARSIVEKCGGLPLGIEVMVRNMKGVDDIHEWRDALYKLERAIPRQENLELFQKLKLSYDYLNNSALQQCFLNRALFNYKIELEEFIEYLIDEEVINEESRQAEFDAGQTMLNRLEKVCLLECYADQYVGEMHGLIRNMAIQIMESNRKVMVKTGAGLVEIPNYDKWGEDLVKVSLVDNCIKEIPSGHSPRCLNLSTLLLRRNYQLTMIADSFFEQLYGLKILDLSDTNIYELPSSISHLENLNALVLRRCSNLKHVPSLALLKILKRLDLSGCSEVENGPQGMEMLSNLRCLDLRGTKIKELPIGIFANIFRLQVLLLPNSLKVEGKELESLRKLEILECTFPDFGEFNIFTTSTPLSNLNHYNLYAGDDISYTQIRQLIVQREVYFLSQDFCKGEDALLLPENLEIVNFQNCTIRKSGLRLKNVTQLKCLHIERCDGMEYLICLSFSPSIFQSLKKIYISHLVDLHFLFSGEDDALRKSILSPSHPTFSLLKEFWIIDCPKMKKLFPPGLVSNLQNLETLRVEFCDEMEEIFAMEEGQESHDSNCGTQFSLPKLKSLELSCLPQLKSICRGNITCNSLKEIAVFGCGKLKRMPLSLVLMENDTRFDYPKMKKLFPPGLVSNLQNLETLRVQYCDKMEEIFAMEGQENHDSNCGTQFSLPKLKSFELFCLPQLKSICRGNITCNSLEDIEVVDCRKLKRMLLSLVLMENDTRFDYPKMKKLFPPGLVSNLQNLETKVDSCGKLKRMPLSLVLMENDQLSPLPSLERIEMFPEEWWWESVELVHPNAKNLLSPIFIDNRWNDFLWSEDDSEDSD